MKWSTVAPGIRCREHSTRKHGVKPDRYFTLRLYVDGKRVEEALGWASEGWTLARALGELGKLREAKRIGDGPATLRDKRAAARKADLAQADEDARRERLDRRVTDLWDRYSKEVMAVENKPRTIAQKTRMWERRIKPAIGAIKIREVTEEDAGAVVRAPLRHDPTGRVIGGKGEGGNLYRLLHHLFSKALGWGLRPKELGNPLENVVEPKVARRERLLAGKEVAALLAALEEAVEEEHPQITALIRVKFMTGARISDLLCLRWEDIRREEMELHLIDTKSGFSRRPMSAQTLRELDAVEKMPGVPFVFRGITNPTRPLSYQTARKAFARIKSRAGIANCTLHTIRHWFTTETANSVSNPRIGMSLTGHRSHAAYMNYVHSDREQAHALAEKMAKLPGQLSKTKSNVVRIRKGQS